MKKNSKPEFEETFFHEAVEGGHRNLEQPASQGVFGGVLVIALIAAGAVLWRVGTLGIAHGARYRDRAEANAHREIDTPANRGIVTDRFGEVLARNTASFSVFADAGKLLKDATTLEKVIGILGDVLHADGEEMRRVIRESNLEASGLIPLVRALTQKEAIEVNALELPGIEIVDDYEREYVDGPVFAHLIGYTGLADEGSAVVGKTGIEAVYDGTLRGEDGYALDYRNAKGERLETRIVREAKPGEELQLTIDAGLQRYLYHRFQVGLEAVGSRAGVGIALDPRTGEVLALVNLPSFDNNAFVDRARNGERARLLTDRERPLFNRAIAGNYNPGSTIKPLHAVAALHEGVMQPGETVYSSGVLEIANPYNPDAPGRFLDWKANGAVDVRAALARSSNIYFYVAGGGVPAGQTTPAHKGLGIEKLHSYWSLFKFDEVTGIDVSGERAGFLPDPEEKQARSGDPWRLGDTYNVSIGQGDLSVTPLQLLGMIASIANGGRVMEPFVARHEGVPKTLFDYHDWSSEIAEVRAGMRDAVTKSYGTVVTLNDLPMPVSGKTGSAQIERNKSVNAFFAGYAPSDNPEIALLILVEHAREGSLNTLPIAHDVLKWYYEHRMSNRE